MNVMNSYTDQDGRVARYEAMKALRDQGVSLAEIGRQYGISRERVRVILKSGRPGLPGWAGRKQSGGT